MKYHKIIKYTNYHSKRSNGLRGVTRYFLVTKVHKIPNNCFENTGHYITKKQIRELPGLDVIEDNIFVVGV